jgi:hypothetical protein
MSNIEKLNKLLKEGETTRWSGTPGSYGLFDKACRISTIIPLCLAFVFGIIPIPVYYAYCVSINYEVKIGVIIFFIIVFLVIAYRPVSDKNNVKSLLYAVTDKRAIIVSGKDDNARAMRIEDIDDLRIEEAGNGNCHIRIGSPVTKAATGKLPRLAYVGTFNEQDNVKIYTGLVFFNVPAEDGKTIAALLKPANAR